MRCKLSLKNLQLECQKQKLLRQKQECLLSVHDEDNAEADGSAPQKATLASETSLSQHHLLNANSHSHHAHYVEMPTRIDAAAPGHRYQNPNTINNNLTQPQQEKCEVLIRKIQDLASQRLELSKT